MSDKDRRKKDGHDTNKDRQAMREDVKERHERASQDNPELQRTEERIIDFKPGAGSDRNTGGRAT